MNDDLHDIGEISAEAAARRAERARVMSAVRSKHTAPERAVQAALQELGFDFIVHAPLSGTPDIYVPACHVAIFVHGCFWHGHDCPHGSRRPKTNVEYWHNKILRNQERDLTARRALEEGGTRVLTIWQCALKGKKRCVLARLKQDIEMFLCRSEEVTAMLP